MDDPKACFLCDIHFSFGRYLGIRWWPHREKEFNGTWDTNFGWMDADCETSRESLAFDNLGDDDATLVDRNVSVDPTSAWFDCSNGKFGPDDSFTCCVSVLDRYAGNRLDRCDCQLGLFD